MQQEKHQHPGRIGWIKASEFKYEVQVAYHAKDNDSKGAGFFNKTGCFLWGDGSITHPRDQDDLLILDESGQSKEGADVDKPGLRETIEDIILSAGKHNQEQCTEIADAILRESGQSKEGNKEDKVTGPEWDYYIPVMTNIQDRTGISIEWQKLWSEVENWYGDIKKKETGEQFLKRMQETYFEGNREREVAFAEYCKMLPYSRAMYTTAELWNEWNNQQNRNK